MKTKVLVVGGGAAGIMSTLRLVLNNQSCTLIPGSGKDKKKSRAFWVKKIENMPGFHQYTKAIVEPHKETIEWIQNSEFRENLTLLKNKSVESIEKREDFFIATLNDGSKIESEFVLLCTGMMDVQPEISGSISTIFPYANLQLIDYCLRCDGHHVQGKETAVIGHTDGAAWTAIMLHERYTPPSMKILTHGMEPNFSEKCQALIEKYRFEVNTYEITDVVGEPAKGSLTGFTVDCKDFVGAEFAFVSLGVIVYNKLAKDLGVDLDPRGFVLSNNKGETSLENLYVAGDLRAGIKKQVYTAWDSAVDSADDIDRKIREKKRNQK